MRRLLWASGAVRRGACIAGLVIAALFAGAPAPGGARECDISGFDKPCSVQGGVYRALIPDGEGPFPLMVYLYGSGGHSVSITSHPLFDAAVVQRGYALIVPAALSMEYQHDLWDTGWSLRNEPGGRRDEVPFINRVIEDAGRRFNLDRSRVVLVGQSRGAFLIWEIACHAPQTAAAYAAHAGGYLGPLPERCEHPVRFLHSHGLADPIVPYAGRPIVSGGVAMARLDSSLDLLARTNKCHGPEPAEAGMMAGMMRQSWTKCAAGSSLDLLLHGGGHTMPAEWFGAVLDWFEEPPSEGVDIKPLSRVAGARAADQFKSVPTVGNRLGAGKTDSRQRIQVPERSKNSSQ